jgi:putative transposase
LLNAASKQCRVNVMRNVPARAGKQGRRVVAVFVATAFAQNDAAAARSQWARSLTVPGIFANKQSIIVGRCH